MGTWDILGGGVVGYVIRWGHVEWAEGWGHEVQGEGLDRLV